MATRFSYDQIHHLKTLLEQKNVSPERLQELYDSGILSDLLDTWEPKKVNRERLLRALLPSLFEPFSFIMIPDINRHFVVREKFVQDVGEKAPVKISHISDSFSNLFIAKVEDPITGMPLKYANLTRNTFDEEINEEIGRANLETRLSQIFFLMTAQGDGKSGPLLVNSSANRFYARDDSFERRVVYVFWSAGGWAVTSQLCADLGGARFAGERFFFWNYFQPQRFLS